MFCFVYDTSKEQDISYKFLLKFAYFGYIVNMIVCITIPLTMRNPVCNKGMYWAAHYSFGGYLLLTVIVEFFVVFFFAGGWKQNFPDN